MPHISSWSFRVMLLVALASCSRDSSTGGTRADDTQRVAERTQPPVLTGNQADDRALLDRLEREARTLGKTEGCSDAGTCKSAPLGAKGCGGPRAYLVYCSLSTDEPALLARLGELKRLEEEFNTRYEIASTCEFIEPPPLESVGGSCRAR